MPRATAGERLLTTVQNRGNDLAILGNADHGTAGTAGTGCIGDVFAVPNKDRGECVDCFRDALLLIFIPLLLSFADDRFSVFQDCQKAKACHVLRDCAAHRPCAGRLTGLHVVAVTVGSRYNNIVFVGVVFSFVVGQCFIFGVGILCVCRGDLFGQL